MILRAIELRHVGPFRETVAVRDLDAEGLHVLAAPNEAGKSTFIRAVVHALFDRYNSTDQLIKRLKPAGTQLAPQVTVEFLANGAEYRIEKQFLKQQYSRLSRREEGEWALVAENDEADKQTRGLLDAIAPARGAAQAAHWGLLAYLWSRQGMAAAWPELKGEAGETVRHELAAVDLDPVLDAMVKKLDEAVEKQLTQGGAPKAHGPLKVAETAFEEHTQELEEITEKLSEFREKREAQQTASGERSKLESELEKRKESLKTLEAQAEVIRNALKRVEELTKEKKACDKQLEEVAGADTRLKGLAAELKTDRVNQAKLANSVDKKNTALTELDQNIRAARTERDGANNLKAQWDEYEQRLKQLADLRRGVQELDVSRAALDKAGQHHQAIEGKRAELASLPTVDADQLDKLEKLDKDIAECRINLNALSVTVELEPQADGVVEVEQSGTTENHTLTAGQTTTLHTPDAVELSLPGWGQLRIRSGAGDARAVAGQLADHEKALAAKLADAGCRDLKHASEANAQRNILETEISKLTIKLEHSLGSHADVVSLRQQVGQRKQQVEAQRPRLQPTPEEAALSDESLETAQAEGTQNHKAQQGVYSQKEAALEELQNKKTTATNEFLQAKEELSNFDNSIAAADATYNTLLESYPEGIKQAKQDAAVAQAKAEGLLSEEQGKLPEGYKQTLSRGDREKAAFKQVEEDLKKAREDSIRLIATIKTLGGQGLYTTKTTLEEKLEQEQIVAQRERQRAQAAKLVAQLLRRRKQASIRKVVGPLEDELSHAFRQITGRQRRVFLNEELAIAGVGRDRDSLVPFEGLSQGAKEQILLCLQGAVATRLAAHGPQILILDDALANTDSLRQDNVLDYLQQLGRQMQVLVLTCHTERYRGSWKTLSIETVDAS